ncbi:hypothetical protein M3Y99_00835400 [Aphelenchoides fujianensis]|nr:hypothetical protein M3Y99_00835400 [Aphelenchoides fujianensis]
MICRLVLLLLAAIPLARAANSNPQLSNPATVNVLVGGDGTNKDKNIPLRYWTVTDFSKDTTKAPILLHLTFGGAGDTIVQQQEGYVFDIAQQLNATLVVVESRFNGQSLPTGVTVENTMAFYGTMKPDAQLSDLKAVLTAIRKNNEVVYVSGSGYAGELAVLLQKQEGDGIAGSIVSNAHLRLHDGAGVELGAYDKQLNAIYVLEGCATDKIKAGMAEIVKIGDETPAEDLTTIQTELKLESDPSSTRKFDLIAYLHSAYAGLALRNFDIEQEHPGAVKSVKYDKRPLKAYCNKIQEMSGDDLAAHMKPLKALIDAYYMDGDVAADGMHKYMKAEAYKNPPLDALNCLSMAEYSCTQGNPNDFFRKNPDCTTTDKWKTGIVAPDCVTQFTDFTAALFTPDYMKTKTSTFNFKDLKKVIFIESEYDPGSVGAVTDISDTNDQYRFLIPGAARFAHLRQPSTCDAENLKQLRVQTINILKCWQSAKTEGDCDRSKLKIDLKPYAAANGGTCSDLFLAYPTTPKGAGTATLSGLLLFAFATLLTACRV